VMNITGKQAEYVEKVVKSLRDQGLRVNADLRNEKIGFKIREHTLQKVPYLLVVGDREVENQTVAVRTRSGEDLGSMPVEELTTRFTEEIVCRGRSHLEE
jgi:threonyl-tRNA synthetase